jgi:hypothetical protein
MTKKKPEQYPLIPNDQDPFTIIGNIPKGMSYQWVALSVLGNKETVARCPGDDRDVAEFHLQVMRNGGWTSVPAKRHPKMPKKGRNIVVRGQLLMQRKEALTNAAREREIRDAQRMYQEHPGSAHHKNSNTDFITPIVSALDNWPGKDGIPIDVDVTIPVRLYSNLLEAAAICHLSPQEYARRMITLIYRGDLSGVLIATHDYKAFEAKDLSISNWRGS